MNNIHKYLLCLIVFSIISCDTFSTRVPENPKLGSTVYKPATSIDILIENLQLGMSQNDLNVYYSIFPEAQDSINFTFTPSNNSISDFADIFKDWSEDKEKRYFNNFISEINKNLKSTFVISMSSQIDYPNYSTLVLKYDGIFQLNNKLPIILNGVSQFDLVKTQKGIWKVSKWQDNTASTIKDSSITWSILKGRYSY